MRSAGEFGVIVRVTYLTYSVIAVGWRLGARSEVSEFLAILSHAALLRISPASISQKLGRLIEPHKMFGCMFSYREV